jgi:hypothetical protein
MKTAVEWLVDEMFKQGYLNDKPLTIKNIERFVNQAKEMEKKQMIEAYDRGYNEYDIYRNGQNYYEQTFKSDERKT